MNFRMRITLYGAAVVGLTLLIFSILVFALASGSLRSSQDRDLTQRGERVFGSLSASSADAFSAQHLLAASELTDSTDTFVELTASDGSVLWSTATLNGGPPVDGASLGQLAATTPTLTTLNPQSEMALRVYVRGWARPDLGRGGYLLVGQPLRGIQTTRAGISGFLWLSGVFSFIAALIAIWLAAGRALRPLDQVATTAEEIRVTGDLSRRLSESRGWSELNRLAGAFNGMLERLALAQERLANALEAQRRFVGDASHELRTPLTTIQSNAGLLLRRPDVLPEDRQAALQDIASEAERMGRLIHDLLTLARADAGQRLERLPLDLRPVVAEVGRQAATVYIDQEVMVDVPPEAGVCILGNADALKQLQWILLNNASRFAGPGGRICLSLRANAERATIAVGDDGPGVPPVNRERIFDRFFQADLSRAGGGAGLGLSIARWIVTDHAGTIRVDDNPDARGALFVVDLPLLASS